MSEQHYLKDAFFELIKNDNTMFDLVRTLAPAGVWFWDLENPAHAWLDTTFWQTLGYTPADLPDRADAWQDNVYQDDVQVALDNIQAHLADPHYPYNQVIRCRHKDGSTVWLRCRGMAICDDTGKPMRMLSVLTNVTARKHAEECQRKNAEAYLNILDNHKAYIIRTDDQGNYTYANDLFLTKFNLERDTIMGTSSMDSIYVADHPKTIDTATACLKNPHQPVNVALRKLMPDGTFKTTDWEFTGLTDEAGNTSEILCIGVDVTEKLAAKADLQRTVTLLEDAGRIANMGGWEFDVSGGIDKGVATFTDQVYAIHELPVGTPIDSELAFGFYHPDDRPRIADAVRRAVEQQEPYDLQCRFITAKGKHRWIRTSGYPVIENGRVIRLNGMFQDITEQKEAELALRESENRYRLLADNSRDLISLRKLDHTLIYASPAYERLLGYSHDELAQLSSEQMLHPDDIDMFLAAYQALLNGRTVQELQYRFKKKDGTYVWMEVYVSVVIDEASGEQRILASSRDITDRKRAELALRESKAQLDLFFSQSMTGFFFMMLDEPIDWHDGADKDALLDYIFDHQRVTKANQAFFDQYGDTEHTMLGFKPCDFFAHDVEGGKKLWREFFDRGYWYVETEERRVDGAQVFIEGDYICLYDDQSRITGHFGVQQDITSRKQAQQTMQATLKQLEQTNNQNIMLMKEIHHRVKNNLAVISALLSLRAHDLQDPSAKEALRESRDRIKVMAEVHELMYQHDSNERIAFDRYLSGLVTRMQRSFGYGKQQVTFSLEVVQTELSIDQAIPLGLVINELLTNTVKHAFPADHPDPRVTITATADNDLTITVIDNGVGMAEATALETSNSLGMTVIHALTEQLEGQVTFANRPSNDVGLQVTLRVPLA